MPFPNEHAARQKSREQYTEWARSKPKGFPAGVDVIWGIKIVNGKKKSEIQSIRFKSAQWTVAEARRWLKNHGFKTSIEPASKPVKKSISEEHFWDGII